LLSVETSISEHLQELENPFDSLASDYDKWFEGEGKLIFSIEAQCVREFAPLLPQPRMEIGVGTGRFAEVMGTGYGLDPSSQALGLAHNRDISCIQAMGEKSPFAGGSFGTITLITTLCFVLSSEEVLREAHRLLSDDGKLVVGLIPKDSQWGKLYESKKEESHPVYKNATFRSYQDVCTLLESTGFGIERVLSTLFQAPGKVEVFEYPRESYSPEAGFVALLADKLKNGEEAII